MELTERFKIYQTMEPHKWVVGVKTESVALIEVQGDIVIIPKVFAPNPGWAEDMFLGHAYSTVGEAIVVIADAYDHGLIAGRMNW